MIAIGRLLTTLLLLTLTLPLPLLADSFDLNVNNKVARFGYSVDNIPAFQGLGLDFGFLYDDDSNKLAHLGVNVRGENWSRAGSLKVSLETRLYLSDTYVVDIPPANSSFGATTRNDTLASIAIGGQLTLSPMARINLSTTLFYAPKILSFGDAENLTEAGLRLGYRIIPPADVYLGYRYVDIDIKERETARLDEQFHIGFQYNF
ncbi:hypothetical protein D5085_03405 [Ectothiorhodospiraceae bacterium BW-2]|nr:hypothetical protein D5085_03405 [Ectothiorhodospiraceae bacterium BW-2]